tara:strand:+ start:281 stop:1378 length:1098 start_codon:yes stop_codon:yes gene_type:complete
MKVLHVINNLATGGAEKLLLETIPLYNEKGVSSDLLLLNGSKQPFLDELKKQNCCNVFSLANGSVYNPLLIFKIIPYLKKYDIVHVHLFPALYFVALAKIISFSKCKLVFTEHSTLNKRIGNKFFMLIERFIYKRYKKIISISDKVDLAIKKHLNLGNDKFKKIENGVNIQRIFEASPISLEDIGIKNQKDKKVLMQVSSFQYPKDQGTVVNALQFLPEHVILVLVGDGVLKTNVMQLTNNLKLENRVFFAGIRMDVPNLLKSADIVVLSSHYEGFSLSSVEGMAAEKPLIATNVEALTEVVKDAGLLFEKNNEEQLASLVTQLLSDEIFYQTTAKKCIARAAQYDIQNTVAKTINLYNVVHNEK